MYEAKGYFMLCAIFFLLSCSTKQGEHKADSIVPDSAKGKAVSGLKRDSVIQQAGDTIFKIADFLVEGYPGLVLEVSDNQHPLSRLQMKSKGDTLYSNARYTLLGDFGKVSNRIVFLRYPRKAKFGRHAVDSVYHGKLAKPDFKTDRKALWYVTMIKTECNSEGVNFAGHYTLATIGCGCPCQVIVVIDRITGRIYYSSLPKLMRDGVSNEDFRMDSRLLIVNVGWEDEHHGYYSDYGGARFYEWRDSLFVPVR